MTRGLEQCAPSTVIPRLNIVLIYCFKSHCAQSHIHTVAPTLAVVSHVPDHSWFVHNAIPRAGFLVFLKSLEYDPSVSLR